MKKSVFALILALVLVLSMSTSALAVGEVEVASVIETGDDYNEVYITIPEGNYAPVPIYDGNVYIGTVQRLPEGQPLTRAPRASYSVNWTVGGGNIVRGSTAHAVNNSTLSYNISCSPSNATDIGFYRPATNTYFWVNFHSSSTSFSSSGGYLGFSETINFAIRNNGIYSSTYSGTYTIG